MPEPEPGRSTPAAAAIVAACDHDPPDHADPHPRLFDDLDDDRVHERLFALWQEGLLNAEWDPESEETEWWLTDFGLELCERDLVRAYVQATDHEIEFDTGPAPLVDPREVQ